MAQGVAAHRKNEPSGVTILVPNGGGHPYPEVPGRRLRGFPDRRRARRGLARACPKAGCQMRWCSAAKRVAAARELTPSLPYIELRCLLTVLGLMKSPPATWALVIPFATSLSTSTSRALSPAGCAGGTDGFIGRKAYPTACSISIARPSVHAARKVSSPSRERSASTARS